MLTTTLWEDLGELEDEDAILVLTKLFETYEAIHQKSPDEVAALDFFKKLDVAIGLTRDCNLNRR